MSNAQLRADIQEALWRAIDAHPWVLSATLTGSFWERPSLEMASDIDVVVIADELTQTRYEGLLLAVEEGVQPILARQGYQLLLNPTLGPLKLNKPRTAVVHLMLYSREAHIEHAIASPFTCLDWQRSARFHGVPMAEVFPVFALQPQHFVSGRRGLGDYLRDFRARQISFRRLQFSETGYAEAGCSKPMDQRDVHEFAYHVMRFLMHNLVKLVRRANLAADADRLLDEFFTIFPKHREDTERLFAKLHAKKQAGDFAQPVANLDSRLVEFVTGVEQQFRTMFHDEATRHVVFRHARTALNARPGGEQIFLGRSDPPIEPPDAIDFRQLADAVAPLRPSVTFSSPLVRCRQSLDGLAEVTEVPPATIDDRLVEIHYGRLEGLSVSAARRQFEDCFAALDRGADPRFPGGGENMRDVRARVSAFVSERWQASEVNTLTCTHNVVLRSLVGEALRIPPELWYRLQIPHLAPIVFVNTREHGVFIDLPHDHARHIFSDFTLHEGARSTCKS